MPALSAWSRRHKALMWPFEGNYSADGHPLIGSPVELRVRWDDSPKVMNGPQGQPITVDATVVLGQTVALQSLMWLATDQTPGSDDAMDQWYDSGSAGQQIGLMEVIADQGGYDMKSRQQRLVVGVKTYKDTLPS